MTSFVYGLLAGGSLVTFFAILAYPFGHHGDLDRAEGQVRYLEDRLDALRLTVRDLTALLDERNQRVAKYRNVTEEMARSFGLLPPKTSQKLRNSFEASTHSFAGCGEKAKPPVTGTFKLDA